MGSGIVMEEGRLMEVWRARCGGVGWGVCLGWRESDRCM